MTIEEGKQIGFDTDSTIADLKFTDPRNGDFTLAEDSPAYAMGFKKIDISDVGPRKHCRGVHMCDVQKYKQIYAELIQLDAKDTLELIVKSDTKEEREFFATLENLILRSAQKRVIKEGLF